MTIHDLDYSEHESPEVADRLLDQLVDGGGRRALAELQAAGEIRAVGAGVNDVGSIARFAERFEVDYYLLAMPYSLVDQRPLDDELAWCLDRGIGIIKGAPYASGILAADRTDLTDCGGRRDLRLPTRRAPRCAPPCRASPPYAHGMVCPCARRRCNSCSLTRPSRR